MCKPLSKFRVDCNTCMCTSNGREFSCTSKICPPQVSKINSYVFKFFFNFLFLNKRYGDHFVEERNEDGYIILRPITIPYDGDASVSSEEVRIKRLPEPFLEEKPEKDSDNRVEVIDSDEEIAEYVLPDFEEARQGNEEIEEMDDRIDWDRIIPLNIRLH